MKVQQVTCPILFGQTSNRLVLPHGSRNIMVII